MNRTEQKIRQLVAKGDEGRILGLFVTLKRRLDEKSDLLRQQADVAANLRHAFMETELDRDRLQRMCGELYRLCLTAGREEEAERIAERFGGIAGNREPSVIG